LAIPLDPGRLGLQSARPEPAGPHAPDLLRGDEPGLLQNPDVLPHAREGHAEPLGQLRDRSVATADLLQNAASGDVGERGERGIQARQILNHMVQYITGCARCKGAGDLVAPYGNQTRVAPERRALRRLERAASETREGLKG